MIQTVIPWELRDSIRSHLFRGVPHDVITSMSADRPTYLNPHHVHPEFAAEAAFFLYSHFPHLVDNRGRSAASAVEDYFTKDAFDVGNTPLDVKIKELHIIIRGYPGDYDGIKRCFAFLATIKTTASGFKFSLTLLEAEVFKLEDLYDLMAHLKPTLADFQRKGEVSVTSVWHNALRVNILDCLTWSCDQWHLFMLKSLMELYAKDRNRVAIRSLLESVPESLSVKLWSELLSGED
jgi:hypothetical protein